MDSPHEIPNEILQLEHLPKSDDNDQMVWIKFALTFDGYAEMGSQRSCAEFANKVREDWEKSSKLPHELSQLRTALFYEQRRWRWSNEEPLTPEEWQYWGALVNRIRRVLSGNDESLAVEITHPSLQIPSFPTAGNMKMAEDSHSSQERRQAEIPTAQTKAEPSQTGRAISIYTDADAYGGSRHVWLRLTTDGNLILEGQDLGGAPMKAFGTREYEWVWSLAPEQVSDFLNSLGMEVSPSADLLESVADALKKLPRNKIEKFFKDAGAAFWNRMGD